MEKQFYKLENVKSFEPAHIFECGQCFRWNIQEDLSYTGIFKNNVLNVKKENNSIIISGICDGNIQKIVEDYFDLNRNYEEIKERLAKVDENLKIAEEYGSGIRLLNQDLWETIISFIISANNNIPRIKKIIERIAKKYGEKILFENKEYYTFPNVESLSKATVEDLRELGLGFRDKRIYDTTKIILEKQIDLEELEKIKDVNLLREKLMELPGVGEKVADCVMLFSSLKKLEVLPVDVWVRRVMNDLYINKPDENKVSKEEVRKIAKQKYGNLAGIAQQYLFYWKRETS